MHSSELEKLIFDEKNEMIDINKTNRVGRFVLNVRTRVETKFKSDIYFFRACKREDFTNNGFVIEAKNELTFKEMIKTRICPDI